MKLIRFNIIDIIILYLNKFLNHLMSYLNTGRENAVGIELNTECCALVCMKK